MREYINNLLLKNFQSTIETNLKILNHPNITEAKSRYTANYSLIIDKLIHTQSINGTRTFKIYYIHINHDFINQFVEVLQKEETLSQEEIDNLLPSEMYLINHRKPYELWTIHDEDIPRLIYKINQYIYEPLNG